MNKNVATEDIEVICKKRAKFALKITSITVAIFIALMVFLCHSLTKRFQSQNDLYFLQEVETTTYANS